MKTPLTALAPKKILIRSTNWIGDAIMTTPAVRTIRENFPGARISVLVKPWVADVFSASPHVDEVIPYLKNKEHRGPAGMWRLGRELAAQGFDLAILLQNAFEAAVIANLAGIPHRAGYTTDGRGLLLTHGVRLPRERKKIHQVHYYQGLMQDLGLRCGPDELFLHLSPDVTTWADAFISELGNRPVIGLNPGAAYGPAKRWPAEKYGALAKRLHQEMGATILVFGTQADAAAAGVIKEFASGHVRDLTGGTSLAQAMALIRACDLFVTNDSGLMHVAAALKTPLVAIFGSTNAVATGPFSERAKVVQKDLPCRPCMKTTCRGDFACMMEIGDDEVYSAVIDLMRQTGFP